MKKIERKLLQTVIITVTIGFLLVALGSSIYFWRVLKEQTIQDEQQKITLTANQMKYIQDSAVNIAKQVAVDSEIQTRVLKKQEQSTFRKVVKKDEVRTALAKYTNMFPYIENIIIVTEDDGVFSSNLTQGEFDIQEQWYQNFKSHNVKKGFAGLHKDTLESQSYSIDVFSYILTYKEIQNHGKVMGDIIVNVNLEDMMEDLNIDMSLLDSYSLFDRWGGTIVGNGELETEYEEIQSYTNPQEPLENGNVLLLNRNLGDNWMLVSEISYERLVQKLLWVYVFFFLVFIALIVILTMVLTHFIRNITGPIQQLHGLAVEVGNGNFEVSVDVRTNDELQVLGEAFNTMVQDVKESIHESIENEKITKELEINQLILQINPHFIYNTLNSIVYMARVEGNKNIVRFANAFISLLQDTLRIGNKNLFVSVRQELKNLNNYLILQEYRYPGKFDTEINCPEELMDCAVPNVFIQPIVENAIFHGLAGKDGKGALKISLMQTVENLEIYVEDTGVGMTSEQIKKLVECDEPLAGRMRKIGVANVQQRIQHMYGEEYGLQITSKVSEGTCVVMKIPYQILGAQSAEKSVGIRGQNTF